MKLKAADDPRKPTQNQRIGPQFERISGQCYKTCGQNEAILHLKLLAANDLELLHSYVEFISFASNELWPKATLERRCEFHKAFSRMQLQHAHKLSLRTGGIQCITNHPP
jgi:hypothetical protein